jgi:hypothetical protein
MATLLNQCGRVVVALAVCNQQSTDREHETTGRTDRSTSGTGSALPDDQIPASVEDFRQVQTGVLFLDSPDVPFGQMGLARIRFIRSTLSTLTIVKVR